MSLNHGAKCTTNNLVFAYDMGDKSSYVGPPVTNKTEYLNVTTSSATGQSYVGGSEIAYIPTLGRTLVKTVKIQNDYSATSTSCCPSPVQHGNGITVSPSTVYTYLILYKIESGYTNANYMYRYEYTSNGGSYVTEQGVHSTSRRVHLGDNWYYAWGTFTTNASTNWLGYCASFYYRYSTAYDKFWVAKSAIIEGDWSGLHPKYWPAPNETRSSAQALLDWAGNNTISADSLTYNSDGTFSFNGSSNYMRFPENSAFNVQNPTIECWVRPNALSQYGFWFEKGTVNTQYSLFQEGSNIQWRTHNGSTIVTQSLSSSNISTTNYSQVVATIEGGQKKIYVNGVLKASTAWTSTIPTNANGCSIGAYGGYSGGRSYWYNGSIGSVKVYNRALTAEEVYRNFQALRGRYGI